MKQDEEIRRGLEAQRLMDEPLMKEAFERIEAAIIDAMKRVTLSDERSQQTLILTLQVLSKVRGHMIETMQTGRLAEIAKRDSLAKRMKSAVRAMRS